MPCGKCGGWGWYRKQVTVYCQHTIPGSQQLCGNCRGNGSYTRWETFICTEPHNEPPRHIVDEGAVVRNPQRYDEEWAKQKVEDIEFQLHRLDIYMRERFPKFWKVSKIVLRYLLFALVIGFVVWMVIIIKDFIKSL
jgi:hypothetical protein